MMSLDLTVQEPKLSSQASVFVQEIISSSRLVNASVVTASDLEYSLPVMDARASNRTIGHAEPVMWDAHANLRFKELAQMEALGSITTAEMLELEKLAELRRNAKYPRTPDEIIRERQQQRVTQDLLTALQAYVRFYGGPGNA